MEVDIINLFRDEGVSFADKGKNTSRGWINIPCPFCPDHSNHLGVHTDTGSFHCWICGETGNVYKLLENLLHWDSKTITQKIRAYEQTNIRQLPEKPKISKIPDEMFSDQFPGVYLDYLRNRGFDPIRLIGSFNLKAAPVVGRYAFRIIAPVYLQGQMVNFVGRDVTGKANRKYLNCPNELSLVPIKQCLYNLDSVPEGGKMIVVEGPADVWKLGSRCVCTFGTEFTVAQVNLILKKRPSKVFVMYDSEESAQYQAKKLACMLSGRLWTENICLSGVKDPGELNEKEVEKIREELFD